MRKLLFSLGECLLCGAVLGIICCMALYAAGEVAAWLEGDGPGEGPWRWAFYAAIVLPFVAMAGFLAMLAADDRYALRCMGMQDACPGPSAGGGEEAERGEGRMQRRPGHSARGEREGGAGPSQADTGGREEGLAGVR